jgi:hypothetical protein
MSAQLTTTEAALEFARDATDPIVPFLASTGLYSSERCHCVPWSK